MNTKERNWQKARLMGFTINVGVLTNEELVALSNAKWEIAKVLLNWDKNTEQLIGHPLPPHKCAWCGKRSKKQYIVNNETVCAKHYKQHLDADNN